MLWFTIGLAILSSIAYHLLQKVVPHDLNPVAALLAAYVISTLLCLGLLLAGVGGRAPLPFARLFSWPIITLGIYHLYWWYKINDEARRLDPSIDVNPVISLLALFPGGLVIVPPFVTVYRTGERIRSMQRAAGIAPSVMPILGLLLIFVSLRIPSTISSA